MLPGLEEALIGGGAIVGAALLALLGARFAARATVKSALATIASGSEDIQKQIEAGSADVREQLAADREHRVWEKRATTYTDAIAAIRHQQKIRGHQMVATRVRVEQEWPKQPVDLVGLEARLIAFSSPTVLAAQKTYTAAAQKFADECRIWEEDTEQARQTQELVRSGVMPSAFPNSRSTRDDLEKARTEADKLSDEVIALIRSELHGD
jgi:hypothetical protein